jgi:hypothetical protein
MEPGHGVSRTSTPQMTPGKNEQAAKPAFNVDPTRRVFGRADGAGHLVLLAACTVLCQSACA